MSSKMEITFRYPSFWTIFSPSRTSALSLAVKLHYSMQRRATAGKHVQNSVGGYS